MSSSNFNHFRRTDCIALNSRDAIADMKAAYSVVKPSYINTISNKIMRSNYLFKRYILTWRSLTYVFKASPYSTDQN